MKSRSLRLRLLKQLLPAMAVILLAGAGTAYWVAWRSATKAYDRALFDVTLAIADQLRVVDNKPQLPLTPQARAVLLVDKFDTMFYAVRGTDHALLDGEARLQMPGPATPRRVSEDGRFYYDTMLGGTPIRVAALQQTIAGQTITILAGETMVKRNALVQEILLGMLLPELMLVLVSLGVVWIGIRSGLFPLAELRDELANRSQNDLRPVRVDVPEEIEPVVTEINELLQRLAHSLDSQRHFVADAAHQLRTPIAALQAQVEAALGEPPHEQPRALNGILSATHRLAHLVTQMLALARAEPSLAQTRDRLSLPTLIGETAEQWLPKAFTRQIDLGFELEEATILGNAMLMHELLSNLIDNALRHTGNAGCITVSCGQEGQEAWLAVDDNGPGISEAERERVFERFYRTTTSRNEGSGLGLAIVREIARQHGGSVRAMQAPKLGGARLEVRLPGAPLQS